MELFVKNWKCIEEAKINLNTITVLMGTNSSGKSSLAYAPYFLAKLMVYEIMTKDDILAILSKHPFFANELKDLVRKDESGIYYPLVIEVDGSRFEFNGHDIDYNINKIWNGVELLSSIRLGMYKLLISKDNSDGITDYNLIKKTIESAKDNSLIIIEEPEIHKHPILIVDLVKYLIKKALKKNLTVVMTTHSDILFHALLKAVEIGDIENSKVSVYYLIRNNENKWSKIKEIKIYDDGTFDVHPDIEVIISKLF